MCFLYALSQIAMFVDVVQWRDRIQGGLQGCCMLFFIYLFPVGKTVFQRHYVNHGMRGVSPSRPDSRVLRHNSRKMEGVNSEVA